MSLLKPLYGLPESISGAMNAGVPPGFDSMLSCSHNRAEPKSVILTRALIVRSMLSGLLQAKQGA